MHDIQDIRTRPDVVRRALARRGIEPPIELLLALDADRRALLAQVEQLKAERNRVSKDISQMKDAGDREVRIREMRAIGQHIEVLDAAGAGEGGALTELMRGLPNLPDADVPDGPDETHNLVVQTVGEAAALRLRAPAPLGPGAGAGHPGLRARRASSPVRASTC